MVTTTTPPHESETITLSSEDPCARPRRRSRAAMILGPVAAVLVRVLGLAALLIPAVATMVLLG